MSHLHEDEESRKRVEAWVMPVGCDLCGALSSVPWPKEGESTTQHLRTHGWIQVFPNGPFDDYYTVCMGCVHRILVNKFWNMEQNDKL